MEARKKNSSGNVCTLVAYGVHVDILQTCEQMVTASVLQNNLQLNVSVQ